MSLSITSLTEEHEQKESCRHTHCAICNIDEIFTEGASYKYCFECGHVYQSINELITEYLNGWPIDKDHPKPNREEIDPTKIYFCPLCMHDF